MSERFKEPVLKTGDAATHRGFESHSLRHENTVIVIPQLRCFQLYSPGGELNLLRKRNWLTPAKLPAGSWGEYNFALCISTEFCYEVISLPPLGGNFANDKGLFLYSLFFQWYPFLAERVIYLRYDIALRAMIHAFDIWRNGYYIMFSRSGNILYGYAVYHIAAAIYH